MSTKKEHEERQTRAAVRLARAWPQAIDVDYIVKLLSEAGSRDCLVAIVNHWFPKVDTSEMSVKELKKMIDTIPRLAYRSPV